MNYCKKWFYHQIYKLRNDHILYLLVSWIQKFFFMKTCLMVRFEPFSILISFLCWIFKFHNSVNGPVYFKNNKFIFAQKSPIQNNIPEKIKKHFFSVTWESKNKYKSFHSQPNYLYQSIKVRILTDKITPSIKTNLKNTIRA